VGGGDGSRLGPGSARADDGKGLEAHFSERRRREFKDDGFIGSVQPLSNKKYISIMRSLVLHQGSAASAGHYIAVARHDTAGGLLRTSGACTGNM